MPLLVAKLATEVCPPVYCALTVPVCSLNSLTDSALGLNSLFEPPWMSIRPKAMPSIRISWEKYCPPLIEPSQVPPTVPGSAVKMNCWICRRPSPTAIGQVSNSFFVT